MAKPRTIIEEFQPDPRVIDERGPTKHRMSKAAGHDTGDTGTVRLRDPLERALRKDIIAPHHYNAGIKFRHHWYHSGFAPHVGSMDLNKVFSVAGASGSAAEREVFHRQQYNAACKHVGMRTEKILADVICWEQELDVIGNAQLGIGNRPQAEAAVRALFLNGLDMLVDLWGLRIK